MKVSRSPKVLIVTGTYPPPFMASGVRVMYLAKELIEEGFQVFIAALWGSCGRGFYGEKVVREVVVGPVRTDCERGIYVRPNILVRIYDIINKELTLSNLVKKLKSLQPDVIISTIPPVEAPWIAYRVSRELNSKLVVDMHDLADDYRKLERPWLASAISIYFKNRVYNVISKSDLVFVTTEAVKEVLLRRVPHSRIEVIYNGVDVDFFKRTCTPEAKDSELRAVFLGDLNYKYHKLESFIKALALLNDKGTEIKFDVIGYGRTLERLRSLASNLSIYRNVTFHGYLPREEAVKILSKAMFGVVGRPSIKNLWISATIRLTTYEYLACGLPILAYGPPNSYTEWFVNKNKIGVYVPSDNPNDIASGIVELISLIENNPWEIVERCKKVAEGYSWSRLMKRFVAILHDIIDTSL